MSEKFSVCSECSSKFLIEKSQMAGLCPECSHYLYGYKNCKHVFVNGVCQNCYWDGSSTPYINKLKAESK